MVPKALLQLILHNLLQNNLKWIILFNCWDVKTQVTVSQMMMAQNLYVQLWNINRLREVGDIERRYMMTINPRVGVFFDYNCNKSQNVLNKASKEELFKQQFHWLIYDEKSNVDHFRQRFQNVNMAVDADVTYVLPNSKSKNTAWNTTFITYDVYNNGRFLGGNLNMTKDRELLCGWQNCVVKKYLSSLYQKTKYENRWGLRDITMRIGTVINSIPATEPPEKLLAHLQSMTNPQIDGVTRFGYNYLMVLKDSLDCNFFYNFSNIWSRSEVVGGVIGALAIEKTVDMTSTPLLPTIARYKYIQPTMPLGQFRQVCIFRTPNNSGIKSKVFLKPFSMWVWVIFGVILSVTTVVLWFIFIAEHRALKLYYDYLPSMLGTGLVTFGAACCQGSFIVPSSVGGRMTFISLSLLTFIIYNYYTSIVVAILLGSPVKSNIKTIDQLAESNLEVALEPQPYTRTYLNFSTLPGIRSFVRNKIKSRKNPESIWMPVDEGLRRVRDEPGFVYGTEAFSGYILVEESFTAIEICDINEVLLRPEQPLFTHLHKNSSYWEFIRLKQARILESGIHRRVERVWVKSRLNCYLSNSYVMQVGLEYTAPLFIMLTLAYMLAALLLLIEIKWKKYCTQGCLTTFRIRKVR